MGDMTQHEQHWADPLGVGLQVIHAQITVHPSIALEGRMHGHSVHPIHVHLGESGMSDTRKQDRFVHVVGPSEGFHYHLQFNNGSVKYHGRHTSFYPFRVNWPEIVAIQVDGIWYPVNDVSDRVS